MKNKTLVHESNWSISYRVDNYFIKYLKYMNQEKLNREVYYAKEAYNNGINTSYPVDYGYSASQKALFIKYKYIDLIKISKTEIERNNLFFINLENVLDQLNSVNIELLSDSYWEDNLLHEFKIILKTVEKYLYDNYHIRYNASETFSYLSQLELTSFVHGDFSLSNIFLENKKFFIVDFEHGSIGPKNWDICYFVATALNVVNIFKFKRNIDMTLVKIISAIRLGRAINKGNNVNDRLNIFLNLHGYNI